MYHYRMRALTELDLLEVRAVPGETHPTRYFIPVGLLEQNQFTMIGVCLGARSAGYRPVIYLPRCSVMAAYEPSGNRSASLIDDSPYRIPVRDGGNIPASLRVPFRSMSLGRMFNAALAQFGSELYERELLRACMASKLLAETKGAIPHPSGVMRRDDKAYKLAVQLLEELPQSNIPKAHHRVLMRILGNAGVECGLNNLQVEGIWNVTQPTIAREAYFQWAQPGMCT